MFYAGAILPLFGSKNRINDRFFAYNVRGFGDVGNREYLYNKRIHPMAGNPGFEYLGDYVGDDF